MAQRAIWNNLELFRITALEQEFRNWAHRKFPLSECFLFHFMTIKFITEWTYNSIILFILPLDEYQFKNRCLL